METSFDRTCKSRDVVFIRDSVEIDVQEVLTGNVCWIYRSVKKSYEMANDVWIVFGKVDYAILRFLVWHEY